MTLLFYYNASKLIIDVTLYWHFFVRLPAVGAVPIFQIVGGSELVNITKNSISNSSLIHSCLLTPCPPPPPPCPHPPPSPLEYVTHLQTNYCVKMLLHRHVCDLKWQTQTQRRDRRDRYRYAVHPLCFKVENFNGGISNKSYIKKTIHEISQVFKYKIKYKIKHHTNTHAID